MKAATCEVMAELYRLGWISTRDGNVSITSDEGFLITPSGVRKQFILEGDLVPVLVEADAPVVATGKPSGELHMHFLLQHRGGATAVVHAHPTYTVAAMFRGFDLRVLQNHFPELFRYTRIGATVPFLPAISAALGDATYESFLGRCDIVGQKNHGVTATGADPWEAFEHIERVEHICKIVLASGVVPGELAEHP